MARPKDTFALGVVDLIPESWGTKGGPKTGRLGWDVGKRMGWLVVWNHGIFLVNLWLIMVTNWNNNISGWWFGTMEFYDFPYIGNVIIPTDLLIFFRGVAQPPARWVTLW